MALVKLAPKRQAADTVIETLTTERVIALHERHFGRLEPKSKARILATARARGWDRAWDMDGLAA